uniref:Uncharacterized protein n=1 Tax=Triticum urartu TaxID=4572 RepID=A0A8R7U498_TRIUA
MSCSSVINEYNHPVLTMMRNTSSCPVSILEKDLHSVLRFNFKLLPCKYFGEDLLQFSDPVPLRCQWRFSSNNTHIIYTSNKPPGTCKGKLASVFSTSSPTKQKVNLSTDQCSCSTEVLSYVRQSS